MREFTVNLTPESAARVEEMRSRIGNAQSALTRLVQIVCAGTPPEAYAAAEKLQAAAWQLTQLRRVLEPQIQREYELFAVPRVVKSAAQPAHISDVWQALRDERRWQR